MSTLESELARYRPALSLDRLIPRGVRRALGVWFELAFLAFGAVALFFHYAGNDLYAAVFFILLGPFLFMMLVCFYYDALYYRGLDTLMGSGGGERDGVTFGSAAILSRYPEDLTQSFLTSEHGKNVMARAGVPKEAVTAFLGGPRPLVARDTLPVPTGRFLSVTDIGTHIFAADKAFADALFTRGVLPQTFAGALAFALRAHRTRKAKKRWWHRSNLMHERGIGAEFSYGVAYELERYLRPIDEGGIYAVLSEDIDYDRKEVERLQTVLARAQGANALLVGDTHVGTMEVLAHLARELREGGSLTSREPKRVVVFDTQAFSATHEGKERFEFAFLKTFSQASRAGNLIVVVERLPQFLSGMEALGIDAADLFGRFLSSSELHIVGTADPASFHTYLEKKTDLLGHLEVIHIEDPGRGSVMRVLEDAALAYERPGEVLFEYQALEATAESAERYLIEGVMPDKALTLLAELVPASRARGVVPITQEFVTSYVAEKTGIPAGPVGEKERDLLLNLETVLHERVIGQDAAISMIASAMRRARSGIEAKDRPLGSFLFLGPTGVGKTETAKALAHVFFGNEENLLRLDMSEFSDTGALMRLLGEGATPGILPNMLREHPYGVLLLDEFEKSSADVRNLFLQVLDEGMFTDASGARVNARNSICIATSNAGSQMIFDIVSQGGNPVERKEEIIRSVIHSGVYTPELLNRFDGVVLFAPLTPDNQKEIARLMLGELAKRIETKGYKLAFDDSLLTYLTEKGHDAQFGARPMRRLIQDVIEEKVAAKIIAGSVRPGDTISFSAADIPAG